MTDHTRLCSHNESPLDCQSCREIRGAAFKVTEFWSLVDQSGGPDACWPWQGYTEKGYGRLSWDGRMVGAHEMAVTFATGEARHPDLDTCHGCGNPICCNPSHLRFDTRASNVADMLRHGTHNPVQKITDEQVRTIRMRAQAGATGKELASEYGVSPALITEIIRGRRRAKAGGPIRGEHGNRTHGRYARVKKGNAA